MPLVTPRIQGAKRPKMPKPTKVAAKPDVMKPTSKGLRGLARIKRRHKGL